MTNDLQSLVTFRVQEFVVVRLEVVDVDHHEAHWITMSGRSFDLLSKPLFEISPIKQTRQGIGYGKLLVFTGLALQIGPVCGNGYLGNQRVKQCGVVIPERLTICLYRI